jgi:hypothetical protein
MRGHDQDQTALVASAQEETQIRACEGNAPLRSRCVATGLNVVRLSLASKTNSSGFMKFPRLAQLATLTPTHAQKKRTTGHRSPWRLATDRTANSSIPKNNTSTATPCVMGKENSIHLARTLGLSFGSGSIMWEKKCSFVPHIASICFARWAKFLYRVSFLI